MRLKIKQGLQEALSAPQRWVLPTFLLEHPQQQPSVSADEKVILELQQQINALRAEVQSLAPPLSGPAYSYRTVRTGYASGNAASSGVGSWDPSSSIAFDPAGLTTEPVLSNSLSKNEAEAMIAEGVRTGVLSTSIVETLRRYGQDEAWIRTQISRISAMPPPQRDKAYPPKGTAESHR